jgi:DNA-binding transcriptional regulator YdaS (Cro superfamily)
MDKRILKRAKKAAGGPAALARGLKISRSAVSQWNRIPIERVSEVEKITGIPRHELRPDIFRPSDKAA